jgi:hypothetical protein
MTSRTLTIPIAQWGQLTGGFIASTGSRYLSWSPLLANDMERQEFEDFITGSDQGRLMNHGSLPPCYVCPSPDDVILNPAAIVDFPGIGRYICQFLDDAGRTGFRGATIM